MYSKKREFLQLAETYSKDKHHINGWYISEKLDGMRAFWDGGLTRGIAVKDIPFANKEKNSRFVNEPIATGLWSRLGKVIHAPSWWLDYLPALPLDGELFLGPNKFQVLQSIVKSFDGSDWSDVQYHVFDSPPLDEVFKDGFIEVRVGNQKYTRELRGVDNWISNLQKRGIKSVRNDVDFAHVVRFLNSQSIENKIVNLVEQKKLPMKMEDIEKTLDEEFNRVLDKGMEGLIIRAHFERWRPLRANYVLKYKPFVDDEGIVAGYTWGKEGKHENRMGSMIVSWKSQEFKLSGFTDRERELISEGPFLPVPGERVAPQYYNPLFPRGTAVTFRYRQLSDGQIPREGRFLRKRDE